MCKQQVLSKAAREAPPEHFPQISPSARDNVCWFTRMLAASDVGTDAASVLQVAVAIRIGLTRLSDKKDEVITAVLMETVRNILRKRWGRTEKLDAAEALYEDLSERLLTLQDFQALALTCEEVMLPIAHTLDAIPSDDRVFAESIAGALLKAKGEAGLASVINLWDDLGSYGCMTAERVEIVQAFGLLRKHMAELHLNETEENLILTAFCQEFERRVGQKRKGRAGRGVESVASLILEYFGFEHVSERPEHFTTGLEIDRWVKCKDGWYIGISCKRTLRERWKQAYTTDIDLLNRHKIKALWHVLAFDSDLSDDKLTEMGSHRAIFYLADDSPRYRSASKHPGMRDYVRPMSAFVADLAKEVG